MFITTASILFDAGRIYHELRVPGKPQMVFARKVTIPG